MPSENERPAVPDRGYGLAVLAGALRLPSIAPGTLRSIAADRIDSALLAWSHDFVGDFAESVALAWPAARSNAPVPTLREMIGLSRDDAVGLLPGWLDAADPRVRYALLKAMAPSARPAISGSEARSALAAFGGRDVEPVRSGFFFHEVFVAGALPATEIDHVVHHIKTRFQMIKL